MLKSCATSKPVSAFGFESIHLTEVAGIVAEKLKSTFMVDARMCREVIAVDGFKVELVRPTAVVVIAPVLDVGYDIIHAIAAWNLSDHQYGGREFPVSISVFFADLHEAIDLYRVGIAHRALYLDKKVATVSASHSVKQEIRQIHQPAPEVVPFRFVFVFHTACIEEHRPTGFKP